MYSQIFWIIPKYSRIFRHILKYFLGIPMIKTRDGVCEFGVFEIFWFDLNILWNFCNVLKSLDIF